MQCVVIGTDHRAQGIDRGLAGLLRGLLSLQYCEPVRAIAEEYHEKMGASVAQRVARDSSLDWYNVDMTDEEKRRAGIFEEQCWRRDNAPMTRVPSDDVREEAWIAKLGTGPWTTFLLCGYLHFEPLIAKLRVKGYVTSQRVYVETVPEIKTIARSETGGDK
jgi:hypothetical protein